MKTIVFMILLLGFVIPVSAMFGNLQIILADGQAVNGEYAGTTEDGIRVLSGNILFTVEPDVADTIYVKGKQVAYSELPTLKPAELSFNRISKFITLDEDSMLSVPEPEDISLPLGQVFQTRIKATMILVPGLAYLSWDFFEKANDLNGTDSDAEARWRIGGYLFAASAVAMFFGSLESVEVTATPKSVGLQYRF